MEEIKNKNKNQVNQLITDSALLNADFQGHDLYDDDDDGVRQR